MMAHTELNTMTSRVIQDALRRHSPEEGNEAGDDDDDAA